LIWSQKINIEEENNAPSLILLWRLEDSSLCPLMRRTSCNSSKEVTDAWSIFIWLVRKIHAKASESFEVIGVTA